MLYNSAVSTYVKPHHVLSAINLVCMPNFIVLLHNTVERITKISDSIISKGYRQYFPSNILGLCNIYFIVRNLIFPNCIILLYIDLVWMMNSMIHLFLVISIIWKCITRKKIQLHFRYEYINDYLTSQWDVDAVICSSTQFWKGACCKNFVLLSGKQDTVF